MTAVMEHQRVPLELASYAEDAEAVARCHHRHQVDKGGMPYVNHLERVAGRMVGQLRVATAWLHDSIEDTDLTFDELRELIPQAPIELFHALALLTHDTHEPYRDYVDRISCYSVATEVKRSDLLDNLDPRRPPIDEDPKRTLRRQTKHWEALVRLTTGRWPS